MRGWKRWIFIVALVGSGIAGGLTLSYERTASTTASLVDAWHEAFGRRAPIVTEVPVVAAEQARTTTSSAVGVAEEKKPALPPAKKPVAKKVKRPVVNVASMVQGTSTANATVPAPEFCDVSRADAPRGNVLLNEIAWMGSAGNELAQWVELKNMSQRKTADLRGWKVLDRDGAPVVAFNEKTSLAPGKTLVLARELPRDNLFFIEEEEAPLNVFSGTLSQHGGWLKLFDAACVLVDEVVAPDGWPGGDLATGATMERKANRGWQTSAAPGGTPRKENSAGFVPSRPVLAEDMNGGSAPPIMNDPPPDEAPPPDDTLPEDPPVIAAIHITDGAGLTDHDAVKLYNPNDVPYLIGGWKLRKRTKTGTESSIKTFAEGSSIPARGYFVWANVKFTDALAAAASTGGGQATSTATLSDDNSVALFNKEDQVIDAVAWGEGHAAPFAEGAPHPENPGAGRWLGRKTEGQGPRDTGDNAADFEVQ